MALADIGLILENIGQTVADILDENPDDVFLYVEAGDNWGEAAIFKDEGNRVIYRDPNEELFTKIEQLWMAAETDKKWAVMFYDIKDGRFTTEFMYPDDLDPEEGSFERRERALAERYGEKPVDYTNP